MSYLTGGMRYRSLLAWAIASAFPSPAQMGAPVMRCEQLYRLPNLPRDYSLSMDSALPYPMAQSYHLPVTHLRLDARVNQFHRGPDSKHYQHRGDFPKANHRPYNQKTWNGSDTHITYQERRGNSGLIVVRVDNRTVSFGLDSRTNPSSKARKVLTEYGLGGHQYKGLRRKTEKIAERARKVELQS